MAKIDDLVSELKQKRDELKLQIHLGSKEARDEWEELEVKMGEFRRKADLDKTGEGLESALENLGDELKAGYRRIRDAIKDA